MANLDSYNLLKSARAAAMAGDRTEAARLVRQAAAASPDDKEAWRLLGTLVDDPVEKREIVQRILALDPFDEEAKAALARMDGAAAVAETLDVLHCANHPDRETMLRCNRCNKPICPECAVQTPVGYRCRECVRGQQDKFYTATASNQALAYAAAFGCGIVLAIGAFFLGQFLGGYFGWIVAFLAGPAAGGALAANARATSMPSPRPWCWSAPSPVCSSPAASSPPPSSSVWPPAPSTPAPAPAPET